MRKLGAANLILLCPSTATPATYETIASPVKKHMSSGCLSHSISEYARFMNFILCRWAGDRSKYAGNISQHRNHWLGRGDLVNRHEGLDYILALRGPDNIRRSIATGHTLGVRSSNTERGENLLKPTKRLL